MELHLPSPFAVSCWLKCASDSRSHGATYPPDVELHVYSALCQLTCRLTPFSPLDLA
jgi:hypothetical protein